MPKIAGIFPLGDTGESFMVAEWHPDPAKIVQGLLTLAKRTEDMTGPLYAARSAFIEDTRLHFESESDPQGDPWIALSPNYRDSKVKRESAHPTDILKLTGKMYDKATSEAAWIVGERSIFFNSGVLPKYAPYHQSGSMELSSLSKSALHKSHTMEAMTSAESMQLPDRVGVGRGNALPQRQFIGLDEDGILEIEEIFVSWMNNLADNFLEEVWNESPPTGGGSISLMGQNSLGSFPITGYTNRGQPILRTPHGPRFGRLH